ncbi:hypothetical protein BSKO_13211 [Bryopsis sp. KO-2023]|nr:hypothetical protein BSKO_13211 [Bryopsis sp. KO-2023]
MAVQRTGVLFSALLVAAALQISTVTAQGSIASLNSQSSATSNSRDGSASASSTLRITSGEGSSVAIANSEAYTVARSEIVTIIKRVVDFLTPVPSPLVKSSYCPSVGEFIEIEAKAVGIAGASVTVDAVADVIIEGEGNGCSNAGATGQAFAVAFAELFVDAIVIADLNGINRAVAQAALGAKSDAFAAVFASATASACLSGPGSAFADQTVQATALAKPIASILVFLQAFVDCSGFTDSFIDAEVGSSLDEIETTVTQVGNSSVDGVGAAFTDAQGVAVTGRLCSGKFARCCSAGLNNGDVCFCSPRNRENFARCSATKDGNVFQDGEEVCGCA